MKLEAEIDRLYGLPLDEFVTERGALAKRLRSEDREAAERVKGLRKPTAGAWALNQAVRRRRAETEALLQAGERLRSAHAGMLAGSGGRDELREAMAEERSLAAVLADCAETIASETGKSGPALRERVRSTLHSAALDEEVAAQLAAGRLVREQEAVGFGSPEGGLAQPATQRAGARERSAADRPARRRARSTPSRAETKAEAEADRRKRAEVAAAQQRLEEAREAVAAAETAREDAAAEVDAARTKLSEAQEAERDARRHTRELEREVTKRERELARLEKTTR